MTQTTGKQGQEAHDHGKTMQSPWKLIAVLSLCWFAVLGSVTLIFLLPQESAGLEETADALLLSPPFSLGYDLASSFEAIGSTLVRVEDEGLVVLDATGREQSFIGFPYRESRIIPMQEGLVVTPARGAGFMLITSDLTCYEIDAHETVYGADYRTGHLLTFGPSSQSGLVVVLYDMSTELNELTLSFLPSQWPVRVAFVPDRAFFDVLLLDLSEGTPLTRLQRYDYAGNQVLNLLYRQEELFPCIGHLADGESILYNDRAIMLTDFDTGQVKAMETWDRVEQVGLAGGKYAILSSKEGRAQFSFILPPIERGDRVLFEPDLSEQVVSFALARDGNLALAASTGELLLYDVNTGVLIARRSTQSQARRILALGDRSFLVIFADDAALAMVR